MSRLPRARAGRRTTASRTLARSAPALALLLALPSGRAAAQASCGAATLAEYLAEGFTCRIGGWTLADFRSFSSPSARGGAEVSVADAADVRLTPFTSTDAAGRRTFGFDFAGLTATAAADGTTSGRELAFGDVPFGFVLSAHTPGLAVTSVLTSGAFLVENATPDMLRAGGVVGGGVTAFDAGTVTSCGVGTGTSAAGPTATVGGDCRAPLRGTIVVSVSAGASVDRFTGAPAPVSGFAQGSLTRLEFAEDATAVVPEPATVALLAGGLLAVAGLAVRRRSTSAG